MGVLLSCLGAAPALSRAAGAGDAGGLSAAESAAWQRWLMPLPKEVAISGRMTVPVAGLRLAGEATELDRNLAAELGEALGSKAGLEVDLSGAALPGGPVLDFRRRPEDRELLGGLRNAEQAYCLEGRADEAGARVVCRALSEHGSYFGMKTLKQLLLSSLRGHGAAATVDLPVGRVLDWPDLEERGQWGGSALSDLPWLSDLKFNLLEVHAQVTVDRDGAGHAVVHPETLAACARYGVRVVPIIHHLEQLVGSGLFEAYPMLKARDAPSDNPSRQPICFAQPEIVRPLADWLADLARTPGITEVMVWLSEEGKGCACEQCQGAVRFVQEVEVCVKALRMAQKSFPGLGLRVLLTQGSYDQNAQVLAALPADVKVSYYHGGRTYNTERKPMIYPVLMPHLQAGRWMGVYPTLCSNWLTVAPFSNPEFVHYRLTEFVDKGLRNIVAYIVPAACYYQVNTAAGLEWAWNARGRSPREFAMSWAVRAGLRSPEQFARWAEVLGPAAWDLYASNFPYLESWGAPTVRIAAGKMKVELGQSIFAAFRAPEQFESNLARCGEALVLAEALGEDQFLAETRIVRAYTQVLQAVYHLSRVVRGDDGLRPEDREAAEKWFTQAQGALDVLAAEYPRWDRACRGGVEAKAPERFLKTADLMDRLAGALGELMEQCGLPDPGKPYRVHVIGAWKTEEFAREKSQSRRLEVSAFVDGPGTYAFEPRYQRGTLGLIVTEARLVSCPADDPAGTRDEAVDRHRCHAGAWVEGGTYTLTLKTYDPARRYAIVAQIGGGDSTEGEFIFRKLREP